MNKLKFLLVTILLLLTILATGCQQAPLILIDEGVLTNISEIHDRVALTFDNSKVVLLSYALSIEEPTTLIIGEYYYLYKEKGGAVWNGYHLLTESVNGK